MTDLGSGRHEPVGHTFLCKNPQPEEPTKRRRKRNSGRVGPTGQKRRGDTLNIQGER